MLKNVSGRLTERQLVDSVAVWLCLKYRRVGPFKQSVLIYDSGFFCQAFALTETFIDDSNV